MTKRKVKFLGIFTILLVSLSVMGTEIKLASQTTSHQTTQALKHHYSDGVRLADYLPSHTLKAVRQSGSTTGVTTSIYLPSSVTLTETKDAWDQDNLLLASQITTDKIRQLLVINPEGSANNTSGTPTATNSGYKFEKLKTGSVKTYQPVEKTSLNSELSFSLGELTTSSLNSLGIEITEVDDLAGVLGFQVYQTLQTYTVDGTTYKRGTTNLDKISQYRAVILPPTKYNTKPQEPEVVTPAPAAPVPAQQSNPPAAAAPAGNIAITTTGPTSPVPAPRAKRAVDAKTTAQTDNATWYLPTDQFPLRKNEFIFAWKTDRLVNDWIRNSKKTASAVTDDDVKNYFVSVLRTFDNTTHNRDVPEFTITKKANETNGQLDITITLDSKYRNSVKEVKRTFFGFNGATIPDHGIKFNYLPEQVLTTAVIKQPVWNSGSGQLEINYVGQQVKSLLPSQFFNVNANRKSIVEYTKEPETNSNKNQTPPSSTTPSVTTTSSATAPTPPSTTPSSSSSVSSSNTPTVSASSSAGTTSAEPEKLTRPFNFVDLFNGQIIKSTTYGDTTAITVSQGDNTTGSIGYLTFNGKKSGDTELGDLPHFGITKIEGYPNDRAGTLNLLVHYTTLTENGTLVEGTPEIIIYRGFQTNVDTGESLFFSWNDKLPEQYANLTPANTVSIFQEIAGLDPSSANLNNFVDTEQAKSFVSQFFTGSEYILDKYNAKYDSLKNEGAQVSLSVNKVKNSTTNKETESILAQVKFAQFGQDKEKVFQKYFYPSSETTIVPQALQATLRPNPNFAFQGHLYSNKLASELTLDEIRNLFNFRIPDNGQQFTSPLDEATFFYAANDRLGELIVSIIFPKFNNIEKYQFSYKFTNFKINTILKTKLELNFTPLINLSAEFLAKDPASVVDLTPKDVLNNLFDTLPEQIFKLLSENNIQIVERGNDYIIVEVSLNWNDLTNETNANSRTPTTQARKTKILHDDEKAVDPDDQVIRFRIDGFTGGNSRIFSNNQSPRVLGDVLTEQEILVIGSSIGGGLFGILMITGLYVLVRNWRLKNSQFLASEAEKKLVKTKKKKFEKEE
ncbi:hypothetical protein J2Z62_000078 [Mycoplasmoides fastidiosum]|uniref:Lipoprotein-associated type-17 domain-containing protein n=1 Tax=Mycoplasmoides fastidiosum TaxID=92758 RepID=A0ABU0LY77_9BACT|nr:lipoprotein 17-related variable surface protein [Mycoplasmoides fastidiosum]MDQ0513640.1 hypothetical protein [Mycoplasmoides fastidiosum]UUD37939.1 lipoprotein 17-related variable surface protein [Mycoplasmoides fastidiosum]